MSKVVSWNETFTRGECSKMVYEIVKDGEKWRLYFRPKRDLESYFQASFATHQEAIDYANQSTYNARLLRYMYEE